MAVFILKSFKYDSKMTKNWLLDDFYSEITKKCLKNDSKWQLWLKITEFEMEKMVVFGSYFWMLNHKRKWKSSFWDFWSFFREQNFKIQLTDAKKKGFTSVFGVWPTEKGFVPTSDKNLKVLEPLCTRITAILNKHHFRSLPVNGNFQKKGWNRFKLAI